MSDKKEIATLSIKISVDSTDLDNLEAQLKRIAGLMVHAGLKEPARGGFVSDSFGINDGQVFINSAFRTSATISEAMAKAAKEGAIKGAEGARFKITTGINHNHEQQSAIAILESSAVTARLSEAISCEDSELEKFKQQVENNFRELESSVISIQDSLARAECAHAEAIRQLAIDMQRSRSGFC